MKTKMMKKKLKNLKLNFSDDLNALVEGEESLAEGFKDKAALIFERCYFI